MTETLEPHILRSHKGKSFIGITATFLCHDGKGNIYMARRSKNARDEQGKWDTGAGGIKWGETAEQTVRREVKEEYGAVVKSFVFLGYDDVFRKLDDGTPTHWLALRFAVLVDPQQVSIREKESFEEGGWFTRKKLPTPLHSQLPPLFKKYKKELDKILGA